MTASCEEPAVYVYLVTVDGWPTAAFATRYAANKTRDRIVVMDGSEVRVLRREVFRHYTDWVLSE